MKEKKVPPCKVRHWEVFSGFWRFFHLAQMEGPLSLDCPPLFSPSLPFIQYLCYCPVFTFHFPLCLALSLLFLFHSPLHLVSRYLSHPLPPPLPLRCRMSLVGSSFKLKRRGPCLWGGAALTHLIQHKHGDGCRATWQRWIKQHGSRWLFLWVSCFPPAGLCRLCERGVVITWVPAIAPGGGVYFYPHHIAKEMWAGSVSSPSLLDALGGIIL